ncbi:hypothetical protein AVEN_54707-1 [Araneus ventricosus]|uniref:Uncharacterized protein n=1 Tax=Araneus ventricosus TaxID=182803 RepID=A0A4Y2HCK5_ARAVE|nr:hypothetical protein AVEN_54707-1 [Araneus ventricosus]
MPCPLFTPLITHNQEAQFSPHALPTTKKHNSRLIHYPQPRSTILASYITHNQEAQFSPHTLPTTKRHNFRSHNYPLVTSTAIPTVLNAYITQFRPETTYTLHIQF